VRRPAWPGANNNLVFAVAINITQGQIYSALKALIKSQKIRFFRKI
jgi:hypothetical protein